MDLPYGCSITCLLYGFCQDFILYFSLLFLKSVLSFVTFWFVFPPLWLHDLFHLITCVFKTCPPPCLVSFVYKLSTLPYWLLFACLASAAGFLYLFCGLETFADSSFGHFVTTVCCRLCGMMLIKTCTDMWWCFIIFDWPGSVSLLSAKLLLILWVQCHFALLIPQNKLIHAVLTGCFLFIIYSEGLRSRSFIENKPPNSSMVSD